MKIDYEARFHTALRRIMAYMTTSQLRRAAEKQYGLSYDEALEYAYENVRGEAVAALKGYRRKKPAAALAPTPEKDASMPYMTNEALAQVCDESAVALEAASPTTMAASLAVSQAIDVLRWAACRLREWPAAPHPAPLDA